MEKNSTSESVDELLQKAERALEMGQTEKSAVLIHRALKRDFTHLPTWHFLHSFLGDPRPFPEFQSYIAEKYYPERAHLLESPSPVMDRSDLQIPTTGLRKRYPCPHCNELVYNYSAHCPWCDQVLDTSEKKFLSPELNRLSRELARLKKNLSSHKRLLEEENQTRKELTENSSLTWFLFVGAFLSLILSLLLDFGLPFLALTALITLISFINSIATGIQKRKKVRVKNRLTTKINSIQDEIVDTRIEMMRRKELS